MAEIILNPDVEIIHDKDREIYYLFRQVVDTKFLHAMRHHLEKEDHCYHSCFNDHLNIKQLSLKQFIDGNTQFRPKEILEQVLEQVNDELLESITNIISIYKECERRGIRLK